MTRRTEDLGDALAYHATDAHRPAGRLSDIILGGQDGLVNVLGVILGVAGATAEARVVLAGGLACALAESLSMAAVAYTSKQAERAHYESERAREQRHIERVPFLERDEVREIYRRKGFDGELLDRIVATITSDRDTWVEVMLTEEHGLSRGGTARPLRSAIVVGAAAALGSLIPLLPFLVFPVGPAVWLSSILAACVLFGIGAYKAVLTVGNWMRSGLELATIGMLAAFVGYGIGLLFQK